VTRAIFWDNDGVLVETERLYFRATAAVLREAGRGLTEAEYRQHFLVEASGVAGLLPAMPPHELEALRTKRNAIYAGLLASESIAVEGAADILRELEGRFLMAVVTSSLREHFDLIHARTGFSSYFRFVLASGDYAETKPHPAPYLAAIEAARALGVPREECLVIEDSRRGLTSAKAAGLRTWVIPGTLADPADFEGADRVLESIRDVPRLLAAEGSD
jgi:HAD superfamily hydrolase (TIGR01509 family)